MYRKKYCAAGCALCAACAIFCVRDSSDAIYRVVDSPTALPFQQRGHAKIIRIITQILPPTCLYAKKALIYAPN